MFGDFGNDLGLNVVRAELCFRHAVAYRKAAGRQRQLVADLSHRVHCPR